MSKADSFPLSQSQAKWAVILSVAYGLLVVVGASHYYIVSGDSRFPLNYVIIISITGICAWGIHRRRRWAWAIAAAFAIWQTFYGVNGVITFLNAGGLGAPTPLKMIMGLIALRTTVQLALLILLVLLADREKMFKG